MNTITMQNLRFKRMPSHREVVVLPIKNYEL